jgi:hypothetical protein
MGLFYNRFKVAIIFNIVKVSILGLKSSDNLLYILSMMVGRENLCILNEC